jgi:hypothetical protein
MQLHQAISLQAAHMVYAVLLKNGGHVGFRNVIAERAITEEDMGIRAWRKLSMPFDDALACLFNLILVNRLIKAGKQHAVANAVDRLSVHLSAFDWNGKINATLQKKLVKDVIFRTTLKQVILMRQ